MDDFFDNVNDNLEDRAGLLAAAGAVQGLKNQGRQLGKLDEIKQAHENASKIEQERLDIERERLDLEKVKIDEHKAAEQSIKVLRRLMVDVGSDLRDIGAKFPI